MGIKIIRFFLSQNCGQFIIFMACRSIRILQHGSVAKRIFAILGFLATVAGLAGMIVFYIQWLVSLDRYIKSTRSKTFDYLFNVCASCAGFGFVAAFFWVFWWILWDWECLNKAQTPMFWLAMAFTCFEIGFGITLCVKVREDYFCFEVGIWGEKDRDCKYSFPGNCALCCVLILAVICDFVASILGSGTAV